MIEQLFHAILPSVEHFHVIGYWVAFCAAFLETALVIGLLLPGSTLLLLFGALSATGRLDFGYLLCFAIAGAILGDNLNYWLGKRYGQRWTRDGIWYLKPEHFDRARKFFDAHGAKSVFLARFIPSIKEIAPFIAGTVGMRRRTFFFWNILGGIGWGLQWVGGGYLFGQSLSLAQTWMSRAGMAVLVLLLIWLLLWLLKQAAVRHGPEVLSLLASLSRSIAEAIRGNPHVQQLSQRHPKIVQFVAKRTDRSHFFGLPLTLLALAFGYVLALFGGIVEDLIAADPIVSVDHAVAQLVAVFRSPALVAPFLWITSLGGLPVIGPLLLLACVMLWLLRRQWLVAPLLASSLGAVAFTQLGKLAFHRPRPMEAALLESSYSFPSGHATLAVAFYGFLGYLLMRYAERWKIRVNLFFLTGALILLIGLSRIVLGVHYLSDVWAGYLLGALWLIIGISQSEWLSAQGRIDWKSRAEVKRRWAAAGLGVVAVTWYLGFTITWHPPRHIPAPARAVTITGPINDYLVEQHAAYTQTLLGETEQPLGFALVAEDREALMHSLQRAGWHAADEISLHNMVSLATRGMDYATAPLAPAFWNGRINDLAMEKMVHDADARAVATVRL